MTGGTGPGCLVDLVDGVPAAGAPRVLVDPAVPRVAEDALRGLFDPPARQDPPAARRARWSS